MNSNTEKNAHLSLLITRVALGSVIFAHGAQKLFGWFGGYGFEATMQYFTATAGVSYFIGVLVILGESLGAIALVLGLFGRFMAACIIVIMIGALVIDHASRGFYMDWYGTMNGEGYEFDILAIGLGLSIVIAGSGGYSLDAILKEKFFKESRPLRALLS